MTHEREFTGVVDDDGRLHVDFPKALQAYYARFKGEEVTILIRPKRETRSLRQNAGFHAMVTPWARDEGHAIEDLKRDLLRAVFGLRERVNVVTGEVTEELAEPHTSKLSVAQFSELIERTLEIAAGCGYVLTPPDEYKRQHPDKYPEFTRRQARKKAA